ncbi:hypothetical protein M2189_007983 [Bradyrhizobium japonicum]|uniref:hypothetical protein n=1 Tax=Bradyrhizobium japonicum TaxID=375 RepID=UPI0004B5B2BA|nr:hypothetical protein [Bradyrhizobium japonicum]MBR0728232.1 hypothetical protein [Bradyrhizobium japonicum]MBR0802889.1 hypothetical protein [Bradyrhizobium japonicum]MCS3502507.1 hypothetical protein [Bradyrhizobium japonicum]MCS3964780.1 hypothetical protein [Bradyrhizobium japonicum]MCS3997087.1 hypothetical protein [Bradyrhizobium japonicum]
MADKTNFTKDEWALLLRSPMNAGMAITAAEPSGLFGLLKESFAGGTALARAATDPNATPLVKAVVADFQTSDGRAAAHDGLKAELSKSTPTEIKSKTIASLREVTSLLAAKAPDDAAAFKGWLRQISQKTAEAASEGGGLFGGGVQVSDAEKATLGEISSALGI